MTQSFHHLIARQSPARAAVRDLQDRAVVGRLSRSSGLEIRRRLGGTHAQFLQDETRRTSTTAGEARWA